MTENNLWSLFCQAKSQGRVMISSGNLTVGEILLFGHGSCETAGLTDRHQFVSRAMDEIDGLSPQARMVEERRMGAVQVSLGRRRAAVVLFKTVRNFAADSCGAAQ